MGGDVKKITKPTGNMKIPQDTALNRTFGSRPSTSNIGRASYIGSRNATMAFHASQFGSDKVASLDPATDYSGLGQSQLQSLVQSLLSAVRNAPSPVRDAKQVPLFRTLPVQDPHPIEDAALDLNEQNNQGNPCRTEESSIATSVAPCLTPLRHSPRMRPGLRANFWASSPSAPVREESQLAVVANDSLCSAKGVRLLSKELGASSSRKSHKSSDTVPNQSAGDKRSCRLGNITVPEMPDAKRKPAASEQQVHRIFSDSLIGNPDNVMEPSKQDLAETSGIFRRLSTTEASYRAIGDVGRKRRYSGDVCRSPSAIDTTSGSKPPSKQRRVNDSSPHSQPGEWTCDVCFVHNTVLVTTCCSCRIVRADAVLPPRAEFKSDGSQLAKLRQSASGVLWRESTAAPDAGSLKKAEALTGGDVLDGTVQADGNKGVALYVPSEPLAILVPQKDSAACADGESSLAHKTTTRELVLPNSSSTANDLNLTANASAKRVLFKFGQENDVAGSVAPQVPGSLQPVSLSSTQPTTVTSMTHSFVPAQSQPIMTFPSSGATECKPSVSANKSEDLYLGGAVPSAPAQSTFSFNATLATPAVTSVTSTGKRSSCADSDEPRAKKSPATNLSNGTATAQSQSSIFSPITAAVPGAAAAASSSMQRLGGPASGSTSVGGFSGFPSGLAAAGGLSVPAVPAPASAGFAFTPVVSFNFGGIASGAGSGGVFQFGAQKNAGAPVGSVPATGTASLGEYSPGAFLFGAPGGSMMASGVPSIGSEGNMFTTGQRLVKKATRRLARK